MKCLKPDPYVSDVIVTEGEFATPCYSDNATNAPMGAYVCDANISICLERCVK